MNSEAKIQELEAKVAELTALVERLLPQAAQASVPATIEATASEVGRSAHHATDGQPRSSRRNLLKLAGAAAAGSAAAVAANALPAAAASGDALTASNAVATSDNNRNSTVLVYGDDQGPEVGAFFPLGSQTTGNIFLVRDTVNGTLALGANASGYPASVAGYANVVVANGVYGFSAVAGGRGVVGFAGATGTGILARGGKANLELYSDGAAPTTRTDAHLKGELICDTDGTVWACVAAGSPGTWRKLAGTVTSGSLHLLAAPKRVYSSRAADEPVAVGPKTPLSAATRTIDCKQGGSGVPAGATGVVLNVTAIALSPNGYLSVSPGGAGFSGTSTLNWTANGAIVANGATVGTGAGATIDVTIGGGGNADFIVDVMGYYL
jgi:hypothetical protein